MREAFRKFAAGTSRVVGSPWIFVLAVLLIVGWAVSGPVFGYSDSWQLVINTTTTIVTCLMVFLIQNTQNRDSEAIHLKLDELIRAVHTARTRLVDLEDLSDEQLDAIKAQRTGSLAEEIARGAAKVGEASLVVASAGEMDPNALRQLALGVRDRLSGPWVVVVGSTFSGKGALVGVASKDLQERGVSAGEILAAGAPTLGGGGSRDPELAQAGGPNGANLDAALDAIREEAGRRLSAL